MIKQTKVKKGRVKPIPPFKTLDEEAEFWASHSVVDGINKGTIVGYHQANKTDTLTIRFQPEQLQVLREEAFYRGIGPTTLARMWILERIKSRLNIHKG
jgi:hypothetical protein